MCGRLLLASKKILVYHTVSFLNFPQLISYWAFANIFAASFHQCCISYDWSAFVYWNLVYHFSLFYIPSIVEISSRYVCCRSRVYGRNCVQRRWGMHVRLYTDNSFSQVTFLSHSPWTEHNCNQIVCLSSPVGSARRYIQLVCHPLFLSRSAAWVSVVLRRPFPTTIMLKCPVIRQLRKKWKAECRNLTDGDELKIYRWWF